MSGKLTIRIAVFLLFSALCIRPASSQVVHHIHPHDVTPPPRPPEQVLQQGLFYKWKNTDVTAALKKYGLEVVDVKGFVIAAVAAKESVIFLMPSYGNDIGGMVSEYDSGDKLNEAVRYYKALNNNQASPAWRIFKKDNILLLISGRVPEDKAKEYENVLTRLQ